MGLYANYKKRGLNMKIYAKEKHSPYNNIKKFNNKVVEGHYYEL